jgi:phosphomevalonate kinase
MMTLKKAFGAEVSIRGGQSGTGTGFSLSSTVFPSVLFHRASPYSYYHLGDEQQACWWPQFRDVVSHINNAVVHKMLKSRYLDQTDK